MTDPEAVPTPDNVMADWPAPENPEPERLESTPPSRTAVFAMALLLSFSLGILGGFLMSVYVLPKRLEAAVTEIMAKQAAEWAVVPDKAPAASNSESATAPSAKEAAAVDPGSGGAGQEQVAVSQDVQQAPALAPQYRLPVSFTDLGPRLLAAGGIDFDKFAAVYLRAGQPLNSKQLAILKNGSDEPIVLNADNAYFLLNFFWALGLVNNNPILTEGAMMQYGGEEQIPRFASTGGWTIGSKQPAELFASSDLISLTPEQQALLEEVAAAVYRPCCNNPTAFPDCNHGMAMLGMLELMAAGGADADSMYAAAKWANAFWFPQQSQELARFFQASQSQDFNQIDARQAVSAAYFSSTGFRSVHQWLANNGLLEQAPSSGNSCGV